MGVIAGVAFDRALVHVSLDRMRRAEAAHVEGPQVESGIAVDDPIGHHPARAARCGDAGGEAAAEVEIVELRREADDRLAVGGDRDRPVDHLPDADFAQCGDACGGRPGERRKPIEISGCSNSGPKSAAMPVTPHGRVFAPPAVQAQIQQQLAAKMPVLAVGQAPTVAVPAASQPNVFAPNFPAQNQAAPNVGLTIPGGAVLFQLRQIPAAEIHGRLENVLSALFQQPSMLQANGKHSQSKHRPAPA